jgi:hypothetical protein
MARKQSLSSRRMSDCNAAAAASDEDDDDDGADDDEIENEDTESK